MNRLVAPGSPQSRNVGRGALVLAGLLICVLSALTGGAGTAGAAVTSMTRGVSAGRDHVGLVGDPTFLSGRVTALRRGQPDRWQVIAKPSNARGHNAPELSSATGLDARLHVKVPGTYRMRLTVGTGATSASDEVDVDEELDTPMVPFETSADGAIRVGPKTYDIPPGHSAEPRLHVLVLDRHTLAPIADFAVYLRNAGPWAEAIATQLGALKTKGLVIVATDPQGNGSVAGGDAPLAEIGAEQLDHRNANVPYSAVGVVGMKAGQADEKYVDPSLPDQVSTGLRGYLSLDQTGHYGYIPSTQVELKLGSDSECKSNGDDRKQCAPSSAGYEVGVRNPFTGEQVGHEFYDTGGTGSGDPNRAAQGMVAALGKVSAGYVVTIQSFSTRQDGKYLPLIHDVDAATLEALAGAIARVGGTRNGFNRTAVLHPSDATHGLVYALVGWAGAGQGDGAESAALGDDGVANLDLTLRPNNHSELRPVDVSTNGVQFGLLSRLMLDRGTEPWPLSDNPGAMRAFSALGDSEKDLGPDPRAAYWSHDLDQSTVNAIIRRLDARPYPCGDQNPGPCPEADYTAAQFAAARTELDKELDWVANVRAYLDNLATPYGPGAAIKGWSDAQTIADKVQTSLQTSDNETAMRWIEFTKILLHLAAPLTHEVTGTVASLLDLGVWAYGANDNGAPTADEFRFRADELGKEFVEHALDAEKTYRLVADALVSDYRSLKLIGEKGGCNPNGVSEQTCPPQLAFTEKDRIEASEAVSDSTESLAYQKLLPLAYPVYALAPAMVVKPLSKIGQQYQCPLNHPFWKFPDNASTTLLQTLDPGGRNTYQVLILVSPYHQAPGLYAESPPQEILDRMFDPVDQGGLGISPQQFMLAQDHREWFESCHWQE